MGYPFWIRTTTFSFFPFFFLNQCVTLRAGRRAATRLQKPCWSAWNRSRRDPPFIRMLVGNAWRQRWRDLSKGTWTPVRSLLEGGRGKWKLCGFYLLFPRSRQATVLRFRWDGVCLNVLWRAAREFSWMNARVTSFIDNHTKGSGFCKYSTNRG